MHIVIHSMGLPFNGDTIKNKGLGGSETAAYYLALELQKRGQRVDVWTTHREEGVFDGVRYTFIGDVTEQTPLGARFEQYCRHTPHDVLIIQRHPVAFHGKWASKINIWQNHDLALHRYGSLVQHGLWQTDLITGVSNWHCEQIKSVYGVKPDRILAVPNGVDHALYERQEAGDIQLLQQLESSNDFKMLYQSRPERGLEHLVRPGGIMDQLRKTDAHLYVCGYENTLPETAAYYAQLNSWGDALPNVTVLGALTKAQLAQVQMRCDLLCYPTEFEEVSCITAMEAMAAGLPILTSNVGVMSETCKGTGTLLVELKDDRADEDEFVRLVSEFDSRESTQYNILRALQQATRNDRIYSWAAAAERLEQVIEDCFARRSNSLQRNLRHCIEHSDIGFAHWLLDRETPSNVDTIMAKTLEELTVMYDFADDGPKLNEHYVKHQGKYYDEHEENVIGEDVTHIPRFRGTLALLAQYARSNEGKQLSVLDYGCAHGHFLVPLARCFPSFQFTGIDVSVRAIRAALRWVHGIKGLENVTLIQGAQDYLDSLPDGRFDVIYAGEVVEHVYNFHALLERFRRLLVPGGLLIATTPTGRWEWTGRKEFKIGREHLHHFERRDIEEICEGKETEILYAPHNGADPGNFALGSWVWSVKNNGEAFKKIDYERKLRYLAPRETVSACLIVKDAEGVLKRCVDAVSDWVDEVVLAIDPATTDDTQHVIERLREANPWTPFTVIEGTIALKEGFAAARNKAMDASCGDWILWFDTDEETQGAQMVQQLLRDSCCDSFGLAQVHYSTKPPQVLTTDWPSRLFRRSCGARFHGLVHEHPEVEQGAAIPYTYLRPDIQFLHFGYVNEEVRRARFRRNYPLLMQDVEQNPKRRINAFLELRDIAQSLQFEQEQSSGHILEGHAERAKRGIDLFLGIMEQRNLRMIVDCMQYYSHCCATLNRGFDAEFKFRVSHPQARDLTAVSEVKGRFYSREHFNRLLAIIAQESTKQYESKHL